MPGVQSIYVRYDSLYNEIVSKELTYFWLKTDFTLCKKERRVDNYR